MPGTMTTDLAVQGGGLLIGSLDGGRRPEDGVPVLGRMTMAGFTAPVPPGEQNVAMVKLRHRLGPASNVDAVAQLGANKVMSASLSFTATAAIGRWLDAQPSGGAPWPAEPCSAQPQSGPQAPPSRHATSTLALS
jgi:hypothetical protein